MENPRVNYIVKVTYGEANIAEAPVLQLYTQNLKIVETNK